MMMIVPTLRVGIHTMTLRVSFGTRSVQCGIPTRSVGTINQNKPVYSRSHWRHAVLQWDRL